MVPSAMPKSVSVVGISLVSATVPSSSLNVTVLLNVGSVTVNEIALVSSTVPSTDKNVLPAVELNFNGALITVSVSLIVRTVVLFASSSMFPKSLVITKSFVLLVPIVACCVPLKSILITSPVTPVLLSSSK